MKQKKRPVDLVVISDVHLGTYGCHAKELLKYLRSIKTKTLILNGDIVDFWQFKKRYWPKSHMKIVKHILGLASKGTKVYYITGNHDETLRKFSDTKMGYFELVNNLELNLDGNRTWFFHGDVFDVIMQYSKWLAKLGAVGYDALILLNILVNKISLLFGRGKISLSKRIKDNVKSALKFINDFEHAAAQLAIQKGYNAIVCGHIHQPQKRIITDPSGSSINYLNSGDWIENLSALEYHNKSWSIFRYSEHFATDKNDFEYDEAEKNAADLDNKEIFQQLLEDFKN